MQKKLTTRRTLWCLAGAILIVIYALAVGVVFVGLLSSFGPWVALSFALVAVFAVLAGGFVGEWLATRAKMWTAEEVTDLENGGQLVLAVKNHGRGWAVVEYTPDGARWEFCRDLAEATCNYNIEAGIWPPAPADGD
jgi:hypothetical protein